MADLQFLLKEAQVKEDKRNKTSFSKPPASAPSFAGPSKPVENRQQTDNAAQLMPISTLTRGLRPDNIARLHPELFENFSTNKIFDPKTPLETDNKLITNPQQSDNSSSNELTTKRQQTDNKVQVSNLSHSETDNKLISQPITQPITKRQQTDNKEVTKTTFSALVGLQRAIILFLYEDTKNSRSRVTQFLSLEHISSFIKSTPGAVKMSIYRLEKKGCIIRVDFKNGRGGRSQYELTDSIYNEVLRYETGNKPITNWQQTDNKLISEPITQPITTLPSSSSSLLNSTTTGEETTLFENFESACEKFGLIENKINSNDLMKIWRKKVFQDENAFLTAVEHIAFYLASNESKKIQDPKAWFYKTLSQGFYASPVGFKSWEQRQIEAEITAAQEKTKALENKKQELLEARFKIWVHELSPEKRKEILSSTLFDSQNPDSPSSRALLKTTFLEELGEG